MVEGEYELGIDDQPTKVIKAGETFYEPSLFELTSSFALVYGDEGPQRRLQASATFKHGVLTVQLPKVQYSSRKYDNPMPRRSSMESDFQR